MLVDTIAPWWPSWLCIPRNWCCYNMLPITLCSQTGKKRRKAGWDGEAQKQALAALSGVEQNTHWLAWVYIGQVCFELLHSPVLVTVDGLVIVLLVGCPDDKCNRTVHNTLIHDSKPFVSSGKLKKKSWTGLSEYRLQPYHCLKGF